MQTNPYDTLGVKETDSLAHINKVYKDFMMLLHPDKSNTAEAKSLRMSPEEKFKYLQLIRKAYKQILNVRKEQKFPDYNVEYEIDEDVKINLRHTGLTEEDAKNFNQDKFNKKFSQAQTRDRKAGMDDPFNRGYGDFAAGKDFNQTGKVSLPSYNPDISVETPKTFARPDMKDNRLVEYIPEAAAFANVGISHQELGLTSISDFSIAPSGKSGIIGSDLNSVYGQNFENWEETVKRDSHLSSKYNDDADVNKRLAAMESDRGGIYDLPLDQKMIRAELDRNTLLANQDRMKNMHQNKRDGYYNDLNKGRLNNGVPHR